MSYPKVLHDIWKGIDRQPHSRTRLPLYRYLDSVGDGSGWFDAITNNSGVTQPLWIIPPAGKIYRLNRLITYFRDTGQIDADGYGAGPALANGVRMYVKTHGSVVELTAGHPLKQTAEWGQIAFDVAHINFGVGDNAVAIRLSFWKAGLDFELDGNVSDYFQVQLNDDFTNLNEHTFLVQGYQFDEAT